MTRNPKTVSLATVSSPPPRRRVDSNPLTDSRARRRSSMFSVGLSTKFITDMGRRKSENAPPKKLENTYRVEPAEDKRFRPGDVSRVCERVMEKVLTGIRYDKEDCPRLACSVSEIIREEVKSLQMPRYKLVVKLLMGPASGASELKVASRSVWNPENDNFASATFQSKDLFALALVFGIYFEWRINFTPILIRFIGRLNRSY